MATRVAFAAGPGAGVSSCLRVPRLRGVGPCRGRPSRVVADGPAESDVAAEETNTTTEPAEVETLDAFAMRVCVRVGRGEKEALKIVHTLRANWFETAVDVASLTVEQLVGMGVPARFGQAMSDLARSDADAARVASFDADATTTSSDSSRVSSSTSSQKARHDGWIGGALPGPDARLERPTTGRSAMVGRDWGDSKATGLALADVRVSRRKRLPPYALIACEVPSSLKLELEKMQRDVTTRRVGGGRAPVRLQTAENYEQVARGLMGWLVRVKRGGWDGVTAVQGTGTGSSLVSPTCAPPEGLSLWDAIPNDTAEGATLAIEYLQWLCEARGIASSTEAFQLRSLIAIAKYVHGDGGGNGGGLEKPIVMELVRVQRSVSVTSKRDVKSADESAKWLDWPDYLSLVERLRVECAPLTVQGDQRSDTDVACAVQRYLLFAILASVPDRQRTLRELKLGKTLVCETFDEAVDVEEDVSSSSSSSQMSFAKRRTWMVRHAPEDYKTGSAYGARPDLVLDDRLYPALEQWLFGTDFVFAKSETRENGFDVETAGYSDWGHRAVLLPQHEFVFSRPNGSPWTVSELSRAFSMTSLRITGRKTNPHLVRDMVVTHVRAEGLASDAELEALAMYMGHSVAMQKGTYDRRTTSQKVAPAVGLMSQINKRAGTKKE